MYSYLSARCTLLQQHPPPPAAAAARDGCPQLTHLVGEGLGGETSCRSLVKAVIAESGVGCAGC